MFEIELSERVELKKSSKDNAQACFLPWLMHPVLFRRFRRMRGLPEPFHLTNRLKWACWLVHLHEVMLCSYCTN